MDEESRWSILRPQITTMYRRILTVIFMLACSVKGQSQTSTTAIKPNVPEETCAVSGMVFRSEDNAPLKNAIVQLVLDNDRDHSIATRTTADGQFRLKNLPAGQYSLLVSRNGYVTTKYGQKKPSDPGSKLALRPGQTIQDLVFRLDRAAVIIGRVFDEDGEPMSRVNVAAMRQGFFRGKKRMWDEGNAETNDRGEYRIYGLPPGRYYLSAESEGEDRIVGEKPYTGSEKSGPEKAYTRLYCPGTTVLSRASTVQLKAAEEVPSVDFLMREQTVVRVRGRVVSVFTKSTERGNFEVQVRLKNQSEVFFRMSYTGNRVHGDGTFELPNITPGGYIIMAYQFGEQMHSTEQEIEVGSTDVEGLMLMIGAGIEVHGKVGWEGQPRMEKDGIMVIATPPELDFGGSGYSLVDKDSQFVWKALSEGQFRVDVWGMGKDCYVKEIRTGENRADGNVVKLSKAGGEVQITISSRGARVVGTVLTTESLPVANAWAVAVGENSWVGKKAWSVTTDQNGHYELRGLPPGNYKVYSWQDLEEGSWEDPEVLKEFEEKGMSIEVQDGDAKTLDLSLIPLKNGAEQSE